MERLQKVLARAGVASRRGAERLIQEGRVSVNGAVVDGPGRQVDPGSDAIKVDGKRIPSPPTAHTYLMLNKPRGYVTTLSDPEGRPTVRDLLRGVRPRVFPIGRLDFNSEGLLLFTDDGELAEALMHPSRGVDKTYLVKVRGQPPRPALDRLESGVMIEGRRTSPAEVRLVRRGPNSWLSITIHEGRKHQVRKMLEAVGHPVSKLRRVEYGGLRLRNLPIGSLRPLSEAEVAALRHTLRSGGRSKRPARGGGGSS